MKTPIVNFDTAEFHLGHNMKFFVEGITLFEVPSVNLIGSGNTNWFGKPEYTKFTKIVGASCYTLNVNWVENHAWFSDFVRFTKQTIHIKSEQQPPEFELIGCLLSNYNPTSLPRFSFTVDQITAI